MRWSGVCGWLLAWSVSGCGPSISEAYQFSFAEGQRAQRAGRYEEAATAYGEAAARAERIKDRDEARFLQARSLERAGLWREAERTYRQLRRDSPRGPRTVRAQLELAQLELDHRDESKGYQMLQDVAVQHPNHGVAGTALQRVLRHVKKTQDEAGVRAWLAGLLPSLRDTDLEQLVEYEHARSLQREGRLEEALTELEATARDHPYPLGALTDDALWHAAEIADELGRPKAAIQYLKLLLAPREPAETLGSYERPRYSQAAMRIAELYRDRLHDTTAAKRAFHRVFTDHPTSTLRDDALWAEARLWHAEGDQDEACDVLETLVEDLPESRYAACARELCPSAPPPEGDTYCRPYIIRELEGAAHSDVGPEDDAPGD